jgi:transcription elongation factor GreA
MAHTSLSATQAYVVSKDGLRTLQARLLALEEEYSGLRSTLTDLRQVKDAEDFDLVEDTMRLDFLEKEIIRIKNIIAHSKVVHIDPATGAVQLGSKVRLEQNGKMLECMVVSALEADPSEGKISNESPLGRALLGKMLNALVEVVAPRAKVSYKIVGIDS